MRFKREVFLNRDGTINVEKDSLIDPAEFGFISGVPPALKRLQAAGYLLVVTNQSGVARTYGTVRQKYGVKLAGFYSCPHHPTAGTDEYPTDCGCRKGKPGMLLRAAQELGIALHKSYMIGDNEADIVAGVAAGRQPLLVQAGHS